MINEIAPEFKVVGFEGGWNETSPITWGAAAIRKDGAVYNSCYPNRPIDDGEFNEALLDHYVTRIPHSIELDPMQDTEGMIVLAVRDSIKVDLKLKHMLAAKKQDWWTAYVYQNDERMKEDVKEYENALLKLLEEYVDIGLVMSAHSLTLNVLNTAIECLKKLTIDTTFTKLIGEAILRSDEDRERFHSIFYGERMDANLISRTTQ